jgi:hypothetical protein
MSCCAARARRPDSASVELFERTDIARTRRGIAEVLEAGRRELIGGEPKGRPNHLGNATRERIDGG